MAIGEALAKSYLIENGYKIIGENVKYKGSEIDLIAFDCETSYYVFAEVKYRAFKGGIHPLEEITQSKIDSVKKGASIFLLENGLYDKADTRFDVITVIDDAVSEHIKDAF